MSITKELFDSAWQSMDELDLKMDKLIVKENDNIFKHLFVEKEEKASIRSISKPITCLCYGIAIEKGFFKNGLDELVYPYLKKTQTISRVENLKYIEKWTVRTLLTLTIGYENKMLDSKHLPTIEGQNYADVVLNSPLNHGPGEFFIYSNAAMYLASVVFQNATGIKLVDFANDNLFAPLGIAPINWKESPQGYNMGCTGIDIFADDLLKIGELLLHGGVYGGKRVVSEEWIKSMLKPQVITPGMYDEKRVLPKYAYGYNMWICKDGIAYCDGTDGQYLIIVPQKQMVIVTTGHQSNMKPITICLEKIIRNGDTYEAGDNNQE